MSFNNQKLKPLTHKQNQNANNVVLGKTVYNNREQKYPSQNCFE